MAVPGQTRSECWLAILGERWRPPPPPSPEPAVPAPAPALDSAAAGDLTDALCEFDAVLADFASPFHERHFHYEEHLERMKRRSSASVSDSSGFSDSESKCGPGQGRCQNPGDSAVLGPPRRALASRARFA